MFRSDNGGSAWIRINDDAHQYGNMGEALAGDPRIFGRVYLGTNGRGILYADRQGPDPSVPPSSPPPSLASAELAAALLAPAELTAALLASAVVAATVLPSTGWLHGHLPDHR